MKPPRTSWMMSSWAKPVLSLACLMPLAGLVWGALSNTLGANPAEALIRSTGDWALRMLCVTLALTPLRVSLGLPVLARFRRLLGLHMYLYAVLHMLAYAWLDMGFELGDITHDLGKRPFIFVGFAAFALVTPLAATSFNAAIRALGGKRWQWLHRAVYGVAVLALLHFFWMRAGKHNFTEVAVYAAVVAAMLGWRAWRRWTGRARPATISRSMSRG